MHLSTNRDVLEGLETPVQPDVDGGADGGGPTVKAVCHHQEMIRSDGEELPVVRAGRGQSLVGLKQLEQDTRDKDLKRGENWTQSGLKRCDMDRLLEIFLANLTFVSGFHL